MARAWEADVSIDTEFANARIAAQFPRFRGLPIQSIGEGYDNAAYLIGGTTVFRFPRRAVAVGLLRNEVRILPLLAPFLPLAIPAPSHIGEPDEAYPYPFAGYPYVAGTTACRFPWTDAQRAGAAPGLGEFLRSLHAIPVSDEVRTWAPKDEIPRADLPNRLAMMRTRIAGTPDLREALAVAESLVDTPGTDRTVWVHGDLHPRHLLVDPEGRPVAVIDWGDVHLGDPALDLSIAFTFLPPEARTTFREAYGGVDEAAWRRARFRALFYSVVLVEYGREMGDTAMEQAGLDAFRFAMADGD